MCACSQRTQHLTRTGSPGIAVEYSRGGTKNSVPFRRVKDDRLERFRDESLIWPGDVQGGVAADLARSRRVEENDGEPGGQRFDRGQSETFVLRKEHECGRAFVQGAQLVIGDVGPQTNAVGELRRLDNT